MKNTLLIDLGNTNIGVAVKSKGSLDKPERFSFENLESFRAYLMNKDFKRVVMVSVVPEKEKVIEVLLREFSAQIEIDKVGENVDIPIISNYDKNSKLGKDRLLNAYFIKEEIGFPAISVDIGSAITVDLVSAKGEFQGGIIFPGFKTIARVLKDKTEILPEVNFDFIPQGYYGSNTEDCIKIGVLTAVSSLMNRVIENYKKIERNNSLVVITGGDARLMLDNSKIDFIHLPELTISALSLISSLKD
ncbi:MAG: type III pantothenate kinase [Candidatus Kaelpia imicola]|nr:type III pantothenate kinase [Candidatus Kaelpia imicola]